MKATLRVQAQGDMDVDVGPETTVGELKGKVLDIFGISQLQQLFIAMGRVLADDDKIREHIAIDGAVVQIFVDPGGFAHLDPSARCQPVPPQINKDMLMVKVATGNSNQMHSFQYNGSHLLYDLKKAIENRLNICYRAQTLKLGNLIMTNGRKLRYYGVKPGMTIDLTYLEEKNPRKRPADFQISVRMITGKALTLEVGRDTTINELKYILQDKTGLLASEQRLIFVGKQLEDGLTLLHYNIGQDSTIHCVVRLRGGY